MRNELKNELLEHISDTVSECYDSDATNFEELHHRAFNENYYIVGYYQAEQWLERHEISAFDAIGDVIEWELDMLGEVQLKPEDINAERIVNLYVYGKGEELIGEIQSEINLRNTTQEELLEVIEGLKI